MRKRSEVVNLVNSWVGKNEKDGSHKEIIDIYNSYMNPLPRNIKMQYNWAWCAATWSALAIKLMYTDIMPIEISCGYLIDQAKKMGCWVEDDAYIPKPGDAVLYDWQDKSGKADNNGWPDHVGTVTYVDEDAGYFVVTEGNYNDSVKKRTVLINGVYIRGFITPKYDEDITISGGELQKPGKTISEVAHEVIAGIWGNGNTRRNNLEICGYNYEAVQNKVNEILNGAADDTYNEHGPATDNSQEQPVMKRVITPCYALEKNETFSGTYKTMANLYLRMDAGTNKKAMCLMPKGTKVAHYGYYNAFNGQRWPLVQVILDGVEYTGFCSAEYLVPA